MLYDMLKFDLLWSISVNSLVVSAFEDILTIFAKVQNKKLLLLGGKACLDTPSFTSLGSQTCILITAIWLVCLPLS